MTTRDFDRLIATLIAPGGDGAQDADAIREADAWRALALESAAAHGAPAEIIGIGRALRMGMAEPDRLDFPCWMALAIGAKEKDLSAVAPRFMLALLGALPPSEDGKTATYRALLDRRQSGEALDLAAVEAAMGAWRTCPPRALEEHGGASDLRWFACACVAAGAGRLLVEPDAGMRAELAAATVGRALEAWRWASDEARGRIAAAANAIASIDRGAPRPGDPPEARARRRLWAEIARRLGALEQPAVDPERARWRLIEIFLRLLGAAPGVAPRPERLA